MNIDFYRFPFALRANYRALSMSYNDLTRQYQFGSIADKQYKWAMLFCCWGAVRSEGMAGAWQDRCYTASGAAGVDKRIERIAELKARYMQQHFGAYTWEALGPR